MTSVLFEEWCKHVHNMYNATGSAAQKAADDWLTSFPLRNDDEAWLVLLGALSNRMKEGVDEGEFLAAKLLKEKILRDWDSCPLNVRQAIQQVLISRIQEGLSEEQTKATKYIASKIRLTFVSLLLRLLNERSADDTSSFLLQLQTMLGITDLRDVIQQGPPILVWMEILCHIPDELKELDRMIKTHHKDQSKFGQTQTLERVITVLQNALQPMIQTFCMIIDRCDVLREGNSSDILWNVKEWALNGILSWITRIDGMSPSSSSSKKAIVWINLSEIAAWGFLSTLEIQATRCTKETGLSIVLEALTELAYNTSDLAELYFSSTLEPASKQAMVKRMHDHQLDAICRIAKIVTFLGTRITESPSCIVVSIFELLAVLLENHLPAICSFSNGSQGVHDLLQLWLVCSADHDLEDVALVALDGWQYLPSWITGDYQEMTPEKKQILIEVQPSLLAVLHKQCTAEFHTLSEEHFLLLSCGTDPEDIEDLDETMETEYLDKKSFRLEAADTIAMMGRSWPEGRRIPEILYNYMIQQNIVNDPRSLESLLWCLTATVRDNRYEYDDDFDYDGDNDQEMDGLNMPQKQDDKLWFAILDVIMSLPETCYTTFPFLYLSSCELIGALDCVLLSAPGNVIHQVMAFLVKAVAQPQVCVAASKSCTSIVLAHAKKTNDGLFALEKEVIHGIMSRLLYLITSDETTSNMLKTHVEAYIKLSEALVTLMVTVDEETCAGNISMFLTAALSTPPPSPMSAQNGLTKKARSRVLRAVITSMEYGPRGLSDAVITQTWAQIDQSILCHQDANEDEDDERSREAASSVLISVLEALQDKTSFIPLLLCKLHPFILRNKSMVDTVEKDGAKEMYALWAFPVKVLTKVLASVIREEIALEEDCSRMLKELVDLVLDTSRSWFQIYSQLRIGGVKRKQWLSDSMDDHYDELVFSLLREVTGDSQQPISLVAEDLYGHRRGLELAMLGLEVPLQDHRTLRCLLGYLNLLFELPEAIIMNLLGGGGEVSSRILFVLLKFTTRVIPSTAVAQVADLLYLILYKSEKHIVGIFQPSLSMLLTDPQGLRSFLDGNIVDWAMSNFTNPPDKAHFRVFIKWFAKVCNGEKSLAEVTGPNAAAAAAAATLI